MKTIKVTNGVYQLSAHLESPYGILYWSSYVMQGKEPILVDTHGPVWRKEWIDAAFALVDPKDVRWIYLSHDDRDHTGNIMQAIEMCPNARIVCSWLTVARLMEEWALPLNRVLFVNHGETVDMDGRTFTTFRPPFWDGPPTNSIYDPKTGVYFAIDAFGTFVPKHCDDIDEISAKDWEEGFNNFHGAIFPWMYMVDHAKLHKKLTQVAELNPQIIVTSHGPVFRGKTKQILDLAAKAPHTKEWVGPSQKDLEAMLAAH